MPIHLPQSFGKVLGAIRSRKNTARTSYVKSMAFPRTKGNLAIDPKALDIDWSFEGPPQAEPELLGDIALVHIRGPMTHHCEWWFESYDEIVERMRQAFYSEASRCVFVEGDTPGGDVSGLFDTAAEFDRLQEETGKSLYWYVDGQTCSAGVALSTTARGGIFVPPEGVYGSIGVIAEIQNHREAAERYGVKTFLVTSGKCKADGHPMAEVTEEMLERIQEGVNYEANIFWNWVAEHRGVDVEAVQALEAGVVRGQQAIDAGLCDELATFSGALQMVAGAELTDAPEGAEQAGDEMSAKTLTASANRALPSSQGAAASKKSIDDARKLLGEIASDNSDEGRRARKMLDAADGDGEEPPPKDKEEPDGDEGEDEADDDSAEDEEDDDEASASAAASSASSAEGDSDDAKKAESEEASAAKCEDDAKKAEAEAGDEDAKALKAKAIGDVKSHMANAVRLRKRAKSLVASAARHRSNASLYRSNAAVHARLAKVEASTGKRIPTSLPRSPAAAAIGATGTRGEAQGQNKSKKDGIASLPREVLAKAGIIGNANKAVERKNGGLYLNVVSTAEAQKRRDELTAQRAKLEGGAV